MAKALPKHKCYKSAEYAFIEEGYTCKVIAEMFDISEATLSKWRNVYKWDDRRNENLAAPHKIREILLKELRNVADGNKPKVDADALIKINKVVSALDNRTSLPVVISVFKVFDLWMADNEPKTALLFTEFHKKYLLHLAQTSSQ